MSAPKHFSDVLQEWVKVFMQRSMGDFKLFMNEADLSSSQVNVLMRLYSRGKCDVSDVAADMGVTHPAASQTVDRLVQRKLLVRTEDPNDRRFKQITLTAEGQALVERSFEARRRWMDGLTQVLSLEEQEKIAAALAVLTEAAQKKRIAA